MSNEYVCGFLFTNDLSMVVLIRKNKPEWQYGKLNGVGGKIEQRTLQGEPVEFEGKPLMEDPATAMSREFREETGAVVLTSSWVPFRTERFRNGAVVHFLYAVSSTAFDDAKTITDEKIVKLWVSLALEEKRESMMYNLPYLIEMVLALEKLPAEHRPLP